MENRKKIGIISGSRANIDFDAFKYFILAVNKEQSLFEFTFPEYEKEIFRYKEIIKHEETVEKLQSTVKKDLSEFKIDYWFAIVSNPFTSNFFFRHEQDFAVITTDVWEKSFAPPSVFEYLLHSIYTCLLYFDSCKEHKSHVDTRGCLMDFTGLKIDDKIDISLGYICDEHKKTIIKCKNEEYLSDILKIISLDWIGSMKEERTVAYNLKHSYSFDINKDSGFEKTRWERSIAYFDKMPFEIINSIFKLVITAAITALFVYLGINKE